MQSVGSAIRSAAWSSCDLELVPVGFDAVEVFVVLRAVALRIDVAAADQQETVEGLEDLLG